ncbi:MAG: thioredoxin 1 [Oceanicoccus sp.]|jgi:thioredoxin 1
MATIVNDANFAEEVSNSELPVMIDFHAEWCGPCKQLSPVIEELATEWEGKVKIVKVNVDESQETAQKYGVMSIPTLVFLKGGEEVDRVTGALPKSALEEKLTAL